MNIIIWNIRGLNDPSKVLEVGRGTRENKVCVVALCETRVKKTQV